MRFAEIVVGSGVLVFVLGVLGYVVGSFALLHRAGLRRALGSTVREVLREVALAFVTQPFLPLYYLVGRRMPLFGRGPARPGAVPIVLVHGYAQNRVGFVGLARALARRGHGPIYAINYPWFLPIGANARRLARFVREVCAETRAPLVDLVCHSMGGLVAMEMLHGEAQGNELHVRKCVTIATPHAGVAWRGPLLGIGASMLRRGSKLLTAQAGYELLIPTLSLFSTHDNVVFPQTTSELALRGGIDEPVEGLGHLAILFSPEVAEKVAAFLAQPAAPRVIVPPDGDDRHARPLPAHEPGRG